MKKGLKEWLHRFDTVRGGLPAKERIKTDNGAKKGHCATKNGNVMRMSPLFHVIRHLRVRSPENGRLGEGDGETKVRGESVETVKEDSHLIEGPTTAISSI
jgi:hypothetical protein